MLKSTIISKPTPVKTYNINLDEIPSKRWDNILSHYDEVLLRYNEFIDTQTYDLFGKPLSNSFNPIVGRMISNKIGRFVSSWIMPFFFWVLSLFSFMFPKEYIEEIRGISNYTKKYGLTFSKIFTLNIGYEIGRAHV